MGKLNLKGKIIFIIAAISLVALGSVYYVMTFTIKKNYLVLEDEQIESDMQRIDEVLNEIIATTESKVSDWANWDDPYFFVQGKMPKFIEQNFTPEDQSSKLLQNDFQIFLDDKNKVIYTHCWNLAEETRCEVPKEVMDELLATPADMVFSGIVPYTGGAVIMASKLILRSDGTGTASGRIAFGRFINKLIQEKISSLTKLHIQITYNNENEFTNNQFPEKYYVLKDNESHVDIFGSIKSYQKKPVAGLKIKKERNVMRVYQEAKTFNILLMSSMVLVLILALYFSIKVFVITPLARLLKDLKQIEAQKSSSASVGIYTKDEIGALGESINSMLLAIENNSKLLESQKAIISHNSKMSTLGEMAGGIAHEINSPLNAIFLKVDIMKRALENNDVGILQKNVDSIKKTVERIAKIVKGLRLYSRDGSEDEKQLISISEVVNDTISLCTEKMKAQGIALSCSGPTSLVANVASVQLSQALLNLINNAADAISESKEKWINVEWTEMGSRICITVTDSGAGIPKAIAEKMMNPFFTTKGVGKGTGLGLSISKGLVENQGGELFYDEKCKNTRFAIYLPKNISKTYLQAA